MKTAPFGKPHRRALAPRARWTLTSILAATLAWTALGVSGGADAGGFSISILGGRRTGMQAMLGSPDDTTALFQNPAGLGDQQGMRFHLSGSTTIFTTEFQLRPLDPVRFPEINRPDCGTPGRSPCYPINPTTGFYDRAITPESSFGVLPYIGFSKDLGALGEKWKDVVVSFAVTAPGLYGADLPLGAPTAYNFVKGYFAIISFMGGAGWKINDKVSVGFGFSYNYMRLNYSQRISLADALRGRNPTSDDAITADAAQAAIGDVRLDYTGVDHGLGWNFGVLLRPAKWLSFGLSYNGATAATFRGGVGISQVDPNHGGNTLQGGLRQFASTLGFKLPTQLAVEMPIPHSIQGGLTFKLSPKVEIGLDYRLWLYNVFKEQVITPTYNPTEPGREPLTRADLSRSKEYDVSYEIATGVLVRPWTDLPNLELMAGASYDQSPSPGKYLSLDNPSLNQLVFSVGARWQINKQWRIALTYMIDKYLTRDVTNSALNPPMNMRGTGLSHIPRVEVEFMRW